MIAETEKVKRFDELRRLLREAKRRRGGATARRGWPNIGRAGEGDSFTWSSTEAALHSASDIAETATQIRSESSTG